MRINYHSSQVHINVPHGTSRPHLRTHNAPKRSLPTKVLAPDSLADHQVAENYNRHWHQPGNKDIFLGFDCLSPVPGGHCTQDEEVEGAEFT